MGVDSPQPVWGVPMVSPTCQYCYESVHGFILTRTFAHFGRIKIHPIRVCVYHHNNPPNHVFGAGRMAPPRRGADEDSEMSA